MCGGEEILLCGRSPGRVEGEIGDSSKVREEFEVGLAVRSQGALGDECWWWCGCWCVRRSVKRSGEDEADVLDAGGGS